MIPSKLSNCIIAVFMFMWFYFFSTKKIMKNIPTAFVEKIFPFANVGFGLVVTLILWSLACNTEEKKRRFQNMISEENLNVAGKCVLSWRPEGCYVKDDEGGRGGLLWMHCTHVLSISMCTHLLALTASLIENQKRKKSQNLFSLLLIKVRKGHLFTLPWTMS